MTMLSTQSTIMLIIQGFMCTTYLMVPVGHARTVCGAIGGVSHMANYYDTQTHNHPPQSCSEVRKWGRVANAGYWRCRVTPTIMLVQWNCPGVAVAC